MYWLCHTQPSQRAVFYRLLNQIIKFEGVHRMQSSRTWKLRRRNSSVVNQWKKSSNARLALQWRASLANVPQVSVKVFRKLSTFVRTDSDKEALRTLEEDVEENFDERQNINGENNKESETNSADYDTPICSGIQVHPASERDDTVRRPESQSLSEIVNENQEDDDEWGNAFDSIDSVNTVDALDLKTPFTGRVSSKRLSEDVSQNPLLVEEGLKRSDI